MAQNNDPTCVFCKGYTVNCGHMEIGNLIELAKKGWFNDSHPIFIPMQAINTEKVNALIDEIEVKACACDMMVGYNCGVHEKISDLRDGDKVIVEMWYTTWDYLRTNNSYRAKEVGE